MAELKLIADTVQQVAEAISAALKVDVEIVDSHNVRIGATGRIKPYIGKKQEYGHVCRVVMRTRRAMVMKEPGFNTICFNCKQYQNCHYRTGILYPVILKEEVIGVVCLCSFDQDKEQQIVENQAQFMVFIGRMAELLSDKLANQLLHDLLELRSRELDTVLNSVHEGIIVVNTEGKITYLNQYAQVHLGLAPDKVVGKSADRFLEGSILAESVIKQKPVSEREIVYRINGEQKICLYTRALPIILNGHFKGAVETFQLTEDLHKIASRLETESGTGLEDILGVSSQITELKKLIPKLSESPSNVLILGESGTGKELIARAIHQCGPRRNQPFIAINCNAIPEPLFESELFGYDSGAFTGAKQGGKPGRFELSDKGTLFLDEIGDMPLYLQVKLLRVLQERTIERIGGSRSIPVDVRIIAATHRNLEQMVQNKEFREDLYYRLNIIPLYVPPLRERKDDIPLLVRHFISKANYKLQKNFNGCEIPVLKALMSYSWPGNIRELENTIEYMCNIESLPQLSPNCLPERIRKMQSISQSTLKNATREAERNLLTQILNKYSLNEDINEILNVLEISRATLYRKLKEYGLSHN